MNPPAPAEHPAPALFSQRVTPTGRAVAAATGAALTIALLAAHAGAIALVGVLITIGALAARSREVHVEGGSVLLRHSPAPLWPGGTEVIGAERIRGVEVLHEHDSEAVPSRADQYWAALRLVDRRRPIAIGERHFDRAPAEADAARLRAALLRPAPLPELALHLPAAPRERLLLAASGGLAAASAWGAASSAGGRPMAEAWPWFLAMVALGLAAIALFGAAAFTGGSVGVVRPATGLIELRRGVGWPGARRVVVPFEAVAAVELADARVNGWAVVVLRTREGDRVPVHAGDSAGHDAAAIQRALVARRDTAR